MTGIYRRIVELTTRNTTLVPQYAFLACKTFIAMLASSRLSRSEMSVQHRGSIRSSSANLGSRQRRGL